MSLTEEQLEFMEECKLEFSDRFTDADLDYKKVYDEGIPSPPIVCPWYTRNRYDHRDRPGGSRSSDPGFRGAYRGSEDHNRKFNRYEQRPRAY